MNNFTKRIRSRLDRRQAANLNISTNKSEFDNPFYSLSIKFYFKILSTLKSFHHIWELLNHHRKIVPNVHRPDMLAESTDREIIPRP